MVLNVLTYSCMLLTQGKLSRILLGFSVVRNLSEVMSFTRSSCNLSAVDGVRVLSMAWIIFVHTISMPSFFYVDNPSYVSENIMRRIWYRLIRKGALPVDSFYVLSGLLVTYLTLKKMKANGSDFSWPLFYVQRYVRLTPLYIFSWFMFIGFSAIVGSGYGKQAMDAAQAYVCTSHFWTHLLYINNLYPSPFHMTPCMSWTWYLANDMQFYIVTPLFLFFLSRQSKAKFGLALMFGVTVLSILITMSLSYRYHLSDSNISRSIPVNLYSPFYLAYTSPWSRAPSYMVGIYVGYLIYETNGQCTNMSRRRNVIGWTSAFLAIVIPVFGMYFTSFTEPLPRWFDSVWMGTNRFIFASGVGWIVYACTTGNGGFINSFLSWEFWLPLSRVTYSTYLFHPIVILHWIFASKTEIHYNLNNAIFMFLSFFAASYCVAFVTSLLVEVPLLKLSKILTENSTKRTKGE